MDREKRKKYNNYSLFTFDEMLNGKLDRWEVTALNGGTSLIYSLVIDMFRFIGDERTEEEILDECKNVKDWYGNHTWTTIQHNKWREEHLIPVLRKRMKLPKYRAEREASWFLLMWSFSIVNEEESSVEEK